MQLEGTKAWSLYAPKYQLALKKQLRGKAGDVVRRHEMGDLLMEVCGPSPAVATDQSRLIEVVLPLTHSSICVCTPHWSVRAIL